MTVKYHSNKVVVGIDPANSGSAVVILNGKVTAVALWDKVTRKKKKAYKLKISYQGKVQETIVRTSSHIGHVLSNQPFLSNCHAIASEDCYMSRNARTAIYLARIGSSISAPLEVKSGFPTAFVKPNVWRSVVLGVGGRTKREELKKISLKEIPLLMPSLKQHIQLLGKHDHITDACGIALWFLSIYKEK
jgi:Holliday junction resolvasome RuvABC endonuclease subunit